MHECLVLHQIITCALSCLIRWCSLQSNCSCLLPSPDFSPTFHPYPFCHRGSNCNPVILQPGISHVCTAHNHHFNANIASFASPAMISEYFYPVLQRSVVQLLTWLHFVQNALALCCPKPSFQVLIRLCAYFTEWPYFQSQIHLTCWCPVHLPLVRVETYRGK